MAKPELRSEQRIDIRQTFLRYLPERVEVVEDGWHALTNGTWSSKQLAPLLEKLQDLAGLADKFGFGRLYESLQTVALCLQTLQDAHTTPSAQQIVQIERLLCRLKNICQEQGVAVTSADVTDDRPTIFYLHGAVALVPRLPEALAGYTCILCTQLADLLPQLITNTHAAIVIDKEMLPATTELATLTLKIPLVVLAHYGNLDSRLAAMRAGAAAFFAAPIDPLMVANKLQQLLTKVAEPASDKILVMDDDTTQSDLLATILRKGGYEVRITDDPSLLIDSIEQFRPDLLIMDLYMPKADGTELIRIIREQTVFTSLPIVFISGETDTDRQLDALAAGGDDFITKPIRPPRRILTIVKNRINRTRILQQWRQESAPSYCDQATGLSNRQHLLKTLGDVLAGGQQGLFHGLLCLEIDAWKSLQKTIDLRQVPALLAAVGSRLLSTLVSQDLCVHIEENRFVVLAARPQEQDLNKLGEALVKVIAQHSFPLAGTELQLYISAGLDLFQPATEGVIKLERNAMVGCALARQSGGNRLALYQHTATADDNNSELTVNTRQILAMIRPAIRDNSLQLVPQAFVNVRSRHTELHELKWRMSMPDGTQLSAADVLNLAKQTPGLSRDLDRWLAVRVLDTMREYRQVGKQGWLLIHQSVETLMGTQLPIWLREELRRRLLVGTGLILEFSLADIVKDPKSTRMLMGELGVMGVETCLGRFSLNDAAHKVLRYLRPPYVKISNKLVTTDSETAKILIKQAHDTDSRIILPHTPDTKTIALAWLAGVDFIQANALLKK